MQQYTNKQIIQLEPITTLRDKQGFRFYSTNDGNTLYAEKNGKIYNVSEDSLTPIGEVPLGRIRFEFVGIINDEDVKNLYPLYYEYKTFGRVKEQVGMAEGGELEIGDYVKIKDTYGGGSGTVEDIMNNFVIVKTNEGKKSYHISDLLLQNDDYEDDYEKGGELESKKQNLLQYLNWFPYNAKSWGQATDELRDIARMARITYLEVDDKEYEPLDFKTLKTPSEWNTKGRFYITDMYFRMSDEAKKQFLDAFEETFSSKMKKGGEIPTITKQEWSKKLKDNKLKTEDGKYYIMKYDDKIGTYLQQVKVLEDGGYLANGGETLEGKILFTINDDKIDELLSSSNLNYQFMDDDGYLLSEKDFEKFKEMVSDKGYNDDNIFVSEYNYASGGMTPGRYYIDNSGNELRYVGESKGKLLFKDGEKIVEKSEEDFEDSPKETKLFGFFKKGGELSTFSQANKIAEDKFGEFGISTLDEDDLSKVINISKANKLAKQYGEDSFISLEESDMEAILNKNPDLLKKSMSHGGEVDENEIVEKLEEQFRGKDLWDDEILDEYKVKMFDFEEFNDEENFNKWKNKNSKNNYIVPFETNDDSYIFILVPKDKMEDGGEVTKSGELKSKIEKILDKVLPGFYKNVFVRKNFIGKGEYVGIIMAASNYEINRVKGQYPQDVSLMLDVEEMDLHVQVFGGNGGNRIYLKPDMNDPREKYLAMASVKIPFRTPKKEEKFVLQAIEKFAENYKNALKENKDRLMYKEYVNYDTLIMAGGGETELVQDPNTKEFTRRIKTKPEDVETIKKIQYMMAKEKLKSISKNKMADGGELKIKDNYKYIGSESLFAPLRNGRNTTSLKKGDVVKVTKIGVDGKEDDVVVNFDGDAVLVSKNKLEDSTKFEKSFVKGGEATFMDKVKAVEKNLLKKKKVPAIVQKDYGKTYDKKEARESAMRIIGSQTAKWKKNKMEKGGKTPAPLKDRIFGSKKNKTGSSSSKTSAKEIELNETIVQALSDKAKEYNEKHSNKVSTSTLKAVMRRGMGAFSSSHRPGMTRQGWGYARVNKFLLKKGGKKVKAGYTQDDDLL